MLTDAELDAHLAANFKMNGGVLDSGLSEAIAQAKETNACRTTCQCSAGCVGICRKLL